LASLGAAYSKLGNADAAINYYLRAHLNDNEDIPIIKNLAELYLESGRSREAKVFLLKYAAIEDDEEGLAWAEGELVKLS
jgi:tetratricopeptide (TPR) repeat protein